MIKTEYILIGYVVVFLLTVWYGIRLEGEMRRRNQIKQEKKKVKDSLVFSIGLVVGLIFGGLLLKGCGDFRKPWIKQCKTIDETATHVRIKCPGTSPFWVKKVNPPTPRCETEETDTEIIVRCGDQENRFPKPKDGKDGSDGQAGAAGKDGSDGADGKDGQDGAAGKDGNNGADGQDSIIEVVDPCGKESSYDEVLFRLSDGRLYALYYAPPRSFLTYLPPGTYITTDGTGCQFTINSENEISYP